MTFTQKIALGVAGITSLGIGALKRSFDGQSLAFAAAVLDLVARPILPARQVRKSSGPKV